MFDYRLALMTGVDIPIPELQITMHQPTIKEISMIGEQDFLVGVQLLCIDKNLYIEDEAILAQATNFQLFMTMMNEKSAADKKQSVLNTLALLFPNYNVIFTPRSMLLNCSDINCIIDEGTFEILQKICSTCFCLSGSQQEKFNPQSEKAKEIARKLMKARQRVAAIKASENTGSAFAQYLSVLTVGINSMSLEECQKLTMYQLYDLVERYTLYINWDIDIRSRLAGADINTPVENWMKQIH